MIRKNVAIIVQKLKGGGAERTAANLSMLLSSRYNVFLIVFDGTDIAYPYSGTLIDLKLPPTRSKLKKLPLGLKRIKAIKRIKKENHTDASISLLSGANIVNVMTRCGDKIITSVRNQLSQSKSGSNIKREMKFVAKRSDCIVALSKGVEEELVSFFGVSPEKAVTIYNPVDGKLLRSKAMENRDTVVLADNSITTMGRLTEQKGQWHLIRAMSEVVKTVTDAKLYILGQGKLKDELVKLTSELGLTDNVEFLGFVEAPHSYILNSKVFAFPSLYEGLGNVLLEAISCGVPCISSDCMSGPREILAPGTAVKGSLEGVEYAEYGILVSVGDNEHFNAAEPLTAAEMQLASAIISMLTDKEMRDRYVEKSLKRSSDFSPEIIIEQWSDIIDK